THLLPATRLLAGRIVPASHMPALASPEDRASGSVTPVGISLDLRHMVEGGANTIALVDDAMAMALEKGKSEIGLQLADNRGVATTRSSYELRASRPRGGVVTQRSAKPPISAIPSRPVLKFTGNFSLMAPIA